MNSDPRLKNIKIKTNVVKRIIKEKTTYEKECVQNQNRIDKMRLDGRDEYDVKKMHEVLQESEMMIPDCLKRLSNAVDDLKNVLDGEVELAHTDDHKEGLKALAEANEVLDNNNQAK